MRLLLIFTIIISLGINLVYGQEVTVSPEISLRNLQSYDVIGRVNETILLYKHAGNRQDVLLYDSDLVLQSERQITLDDKRPDVYEVVNLDTLFGIIYGFREDDNHIIRMDLMNERAEKVDSITLASYEKEYRGLNFQSILSEDESVIALYNIIEDERLRLIVYDFDLDTMVQNENYVFSDIDLYNDVVNFDVSNAGEFFMLTEHNNTRSKKENHQAVVYQYSPFANLVKQIIIPITNVVTGDLKFSVDNQNGQIGIVGLYDEKRYTESEGYFWVAGKPHEFQNKAIYFNKFEKDIFFEVYGDKDEKRLENYGISNVIWKADGTPILVFEMMLDISRRSGGGPVGRQSALANNFGSQSSGWSDHYREDLVLISLDKTGEPDWHRVFYKKQFSQNDGGIFSSYFPFMTPSRMRLIYNDEIKSNSTVSEYILDARGNYKRTSVLSTEYQNLKLRFADAEQISSTELIVPSQKSYELNLVKIDFGK